MPKASGGTQAQPLCWSLCRTSTTTSPSSPSVSPSSRAPGRLWVGMLQIQCPVGSQGGTQSPSAFPRPWGGGPKAQGSHFGPGRSPAPHPCTHSQGCLSYCPLSWGPDPTNRPVLPENKPDKSFPQAPGGAGKEVRGLITCTLQC